MPLKAATSATPARPTKLTAQEVPVVFQRYRTELQNLAQKIGELESEMEEHASALHPASLPSSAHHVSRLVLSTLQPLLKTAPTRPCYRLIGGTLVQRTVTDVFPALETNYSGIKEVLDSLVKTYRGKEEEFGGFQREYGIQMPGRT